MENEPFLVNVASPNTHREKQTDRQKQRQGDTFFGDSAIWLEPNLMGSYIYISLSQIQKP